eukprot:jgi/Chrzof1/10057/Cz04g25180.t1
MPDETGVYILLATSKCGAVTVSSLTVSYVCVSPRHAHLLVSAHDRYGCYAPIHYTNRQRHVPERKQHGCFCDLWGLLRI